MWEVQHYTLADGWINTWSVEDDAGNREPITFDTYSEALLELEECLLAAHDAGMDYSRDEYRIVWIEGEAA